MRVSILTGLDLCALEKDINRTLKELGEACNTVYDVKLSSDGAGDADDTLWVAMITYEEAILHG